MRPVNAMTRGLPHVGCARWSASARVPQFHEAWNLRRWCCSSELAARLYASQRVFSMRCTTASGLYAAARSLEEVAALLDAAGVPLRAQIGGAA